MDCLKPGFLMVKYAIKRRYKGYVHYPGNFEEISQAILRDCYKKNHFVVSNGHFKQFYCRDFGMITEALLKLGYTKEVFSTIRFALNIFQKHNKITTTIVDTTPIDYFSYGADSLPFLMRSIRLALTHGMHKRQILKNAFFLQEQINYYYSKVYNPKTFVKFEHFSSIKDNYSRPGAAYDISAMIGLGLEIEKINRILAQKVFVCPIDVYVEIKKFKKNYWNGKYFYEDAWKKQHIASDANIFPFYWEIFGQDMRKIALKALIDQGLDSYLPIQYRKKADSDGLLWPQRLFAPGYEGESIWLHLGLCYLEQLVLVNRTHAKKVLAKVVAFVEASGNFLEVFNKDGRPYKSLFYCADESMSWIAGYLQLKVLLKSN